MTDGGTDTTHTLIVLEEGAEATVLHESNSVSENASGLHLGSVELIQKTRLAPALCQPSRMGHQDLSLRSPESGHRSRFDVAVDDSPQWDRC